MADCANSVTDVTTIWHSQGPPIGQRGKMASSDWLMVSTQKSGMTSPPQRQQVTTIQAAPNTLMVGWQSREFMFCHSSIYVHGDALFTA